MSALDVEVSFRKKGMVTLVASSPAGRKWIGERLGVSGEFASTIVSITAEASTLSPILFNGSVSTELPPIKVGLAMGG